jgi:hypothetical protein
MREQWSESYDRKTKSWKSQPKFDEELSRCSISGLRFWKDYFKKKIEDFKANHEFKDEHEIEDLRIIQQKYKMVNEELQHREFDQLASPTFVGLYNNNEFDSNTGIVTDDNGYPKYSIDFNENESSYVIRDPEGSVIEYTDTYYKVPRKRKDIYEDWDYYND